MSVRERITTLYCRLLVRWRLVRRMLRARIPEECRAAHEAAAAWLRDHPGDLTVLSAGEQPAMMCEAQAALLKERCTSSRGPGS